MIPAERATMTVVTPLLTVQPTRGMPGPSAAQPQGCTNLQLRQLMRRVTQHYDLEVGKVGLKGTQYSLLSYVTKLGPIRPGDLAAAMKVEPSTLTRNLKPLVAAAWVEIAAGTDGRSRSITITESGRAKRAEGQRRWKVAQTSLNEMLGVQRVTALHALIHDSLALLSPREPETDHD
jgi:DNA-binding MarR family transcriptional regulator